jgi:hypothetical protein
MTLVGNSPSHLEYVLVMFFSIRNLTRIENSPTIHNHDFKILAQIINIFELFNNSYSTFKLSLKARCARAVRNENESLMG